MLSWSIITFLIQLHDEVASTYTITETFYAKFRHLLAAVGISGSFFPSSLIFISRCFEIENFYIYSNTKCQRLLKYSFFRQERKSILWSFFRIQSLLAQFCAVIVGFYNDCIAVCMTKTWDYRADGGKKITKTSLHSWNSLLYCWFMHILRVE